MRSVHQLFIPWTPEEINEPAAAAAEKDSGSITATADYEEIQTCPAINCDFQTIKVKDMKCHGHTEHFGRPFQCSTCGRAFAEAFILRKHIEGVHLCMRSHVCDKCGNCFSQKVMVHLKLRPFKCSVRESIFSVKHSLKDHVKRIQT